MADQERTLLSIMKGDTLTLTDDKGVMTGYEVVRIEGNLFEARLYLKNLNLPEPERVIAYQRVD